MAANSPEGNTLNHDSSQGRVAEALTGLIIGTGGVAVATAGYAESSGNDVVARVIATVQEYPATAIGAAAAVLGAALALHAIVRH